MGARSLNVVRGGAGSSWILFWPCQVWSVRGKVKWRSLKGSCYCQAAEKKKERGRERKTNHEKRDWELSVCSWPGSRRGDESLGVEIVACSDRRLSPISFFFFSFMIITNMCRVLHSPQSTFTTFILFGSCPFHHSHVYILSHFAHQGNEVGGQGVSSASHSS